MKRYRVRSVGKAITIIIMGLFWSLISMQFMSMITPCLIGIIGKEYSGIIEETRVDYNTSINGEHPTYLYIGYKDDSGEYKIGIGKVIGKYTSEDGSVEIKVSGLRPGTIYIKGQNIDVGFIIVTVLITAMGIGILMMGFRELIKAKKWNSKLSELREYGISYKCSDLRLGTARTKHSNYFLLEARHDGAIYEGPSLRGDAIGKAAQLSYVELRILDGDPEIYEMTIPWDEVNYDSNQYNWEMEEIASRKGGTIGENKKKDSGNDTWN